MGRATAGVQNASNNVQSGMGGKGKGGGMPMQQRPQMGGMGGKGAGQYQPQVQQPQGGFGGKGGQQQNPYAQSYYQPQFQPDTFNNPYAQGGFGQQPQMGGFGGKGGQLGMVGLSQQPQGGMGGKGGQMGGMSDLQRMRPQGQQTYQDYASSPTQEIKMSEEQFNAQQAAPAAQGYARDPRMGGMGGKGGQMGGYRQQMQHRRMADMMRGQPSGLAALQQPTATTQAASPAPEQPYMGNYLK